MVWRTALHYAQFCVLLALTSGQLTSDQMQQILDLHNQYRSSVNPSPANMQRMVWDNAVAQVAANYASQCVWARNSKVTGILGESLFMTLGPLVITQPLGIWYNEAGNYNFNTNSCASNQVCGDYTQMVWANTTFLGCAAQFCPDVPNFGVQNATIFICNYYPVGNIIYESPYQSGAACSNCPNDTIGCVSNTCDRGTTISSGISQALIMNLSGTYLLTDPFPYSSAGFTKSSTATLLLGVLTAFYIRMPWT